MTGASCGDPLYTFPLRIPFNSVTTEQWMLVGIAIGGLFVLIVLIWGIVFVCKKKRRVHRHEKINNDPKAMVLNSVSDNSQYKRSSKMSNLEIIQRDMQQRPVSYTPSSNNDHPYTCNAMLQYNNLDTLRSYGSAGDELENVPPEYRKASARPNQQLVNINSGTASSDTESLHKQKWVDQMQMQTFTDSKINNDLKRISPISSLDSHRSHKQQQQSGILPGRLLNMPHSPTLLQPSPHQLQHSFEESPGLHGAYHWDCSDWVGRGHHPLPNITEVPGSEVPDSSSFHSNESNESHPNKNNLLPPILGPVDPARDIETLNEDNESEFVDDSECDQSEQPLSLGFEQNTSIPCLNPLDSGSEDYRFNTADSYLRHPNSYLPKYNIQSETEGEGAPLTGGGGGGGPSRKPLNGLEIGPHQLVESDEEEEEGEDGIQAYGFPAMKRRNRRQPSDIDMVLHSGGESSSLLSHSRNLNSSNHSNSDLSTHLCEIDDSEFEQDMPPPMQQFHHQPQPHQLHHHHHHPTQQQPQQHQSSSSLSSGGSGQPRPKHNKVKWANSVQQTEV